MTVTMTSRTVDLAAGRVKAHQVDGLKRLLRDHQVTYSDIARLARVTYWMVYAVVNGLRTSAPVMAAIRKLLGGVHATR